MQQRYLPKLDRFCKSIWMLQQNVSTTAMFTRLYRAQTRSVENTMTTVRIFTLAQKCPRTCGCNEDEGFQNQVRDDDNLTARRMIGVRTTTQFHEGSRNARLEGC